MSGLMEPACLLTITGHAGCGDREAPKIPAATVSGEITYKGNAVDIEGNPDGSVRTFPRKFAFEEKSKTI